MERVAFLIEKTGDRIMCLLNPETVTVRRLAGIRQRTSSSGALTGSGLSDDPLLYTGGGSTELTLDLLFDTSLDGSASEFDDVRNLTRPLCDLAENYEDDFGRGEPRLIRFVWGKAWNIPAVVAATAERLEFFKEGGIPRRSWLRMRLLRVNPADTGTQAQTSTPKMEDLLDEQTTFSSLSGASTSTAAVEITGGSSDAPESERNNASPTRLDEIADRYLGSAGLWRLIAWYNDIADPLHVAAGTLLQVPPRPPNAGAP
jgi:hypothetical protein